MFCARSRIAPPASGTDGARMKRPQGFGTPAPARAGREPERRAAKRAARRRGRHRARRGRRRSPPRAVAAAELTRHRDQGRRREAARPRAGQDRPAAAPLREERDSPVHQAITASPGALVDHRFVDSSCSPRWWRWRCTRRCSRCAPSPSTAPRASRRSEVHSAIDGQLGTPLALVDYGAISPGAVGVPADQELRHRDGSPGHAGDPHRRAGSRSDRSSARRATTWSTRPAW